MGWLKVKGLAERSVVKGAKVGSSDKPVVKVDKMWSVYSYLQMNVYARERRKLNKIYCKNKSKLNKILQKQVHQNIITGARCCCKPDLHKYPPQPIITHTERFKVGPCIGLTWAMRSEASDYVGQGIQIIVVFWPQEWMVLP